MLNSCEGQEIIPSVVGPMAHSAKSLELFTKTVVDSQPWQKDPQCLPIPWRDADANEIKNGRKLRIGIMHWDGVILPQPPIRKALKDVEEKLKAAGHEVFQWNINHVRALDMAVRITQAFSPYYPSTDD
jgi:amidase